MAIRSSIIAALCLTDAVGDTIAAKLYTIIFVGETGNDPDEEGSLAFLAGLKKLGLIDRVVVIANRLPALQRAQLARGTMDALGLTNAVVAVGEEYGGEQTNYKVQFGAPYVSEETSFPRYTDVFWSTLSEAQDQSVIVVAASGMTDLAELLKPSQKDAARLEALFRAKVVNVAIMGGMVVDGNEEMIYPSSFGFAQADWAGTNNAHDWMATYVFRTRVQELGVTTVDVAKSTAYGAAVPRDVYDHFADTGHPVGLRLQSMQEAMIQHLWRRTSLPADDKAGREGLPGVLDTAWFNNSFCGNNPSVAIMGGSDRIWDFVLNFQFYDQLAVLAGIPELREIHFDPTVFEGPTGGLVLSMGTTKSSGSRTNLKNPERTSNALIQTMLAGLTL